MALADEESKCPHFHLDEYNSLEDHFVELILEKVEVSGQMETDSIN